MSNYYKLRIVLLGILFTLTNCQKDDDFKMLEKQVANNSRFKVSKIGISKIQQNKKLTEKLYAIQDKVSKNKSNTQYKTINFSDLGFVINTNYSTLIESNDNNYHSYTFPILRDQDTTLIENLVLSLKEDGSYKAVIATYDLSQQEKEDIKNNLFVDLSNKLTITELEDDAIVDEIFSKATEDEIIVTVTVECCTGAIGHPGGKEEDGSNCSAHGYCTTTYYSSGGGVGSGYTHDNSNDTGSTTDTEGTSGGGGTTTGSTTNPDEEPTLDDNPCKGNACTEIVTEPNVTVTATDFIVDNTDIKNLNPCPKGIYLELENLQQGGIKRVLNTFCSPNSVYDWQLKSQSPPINNTNQAETDWERDSNNNAIINSYLTSLNPTFENTATKIAIARTILHESIHAYFLSQIDGLQNGTTNQAQFQNNFPLLWDVYVDDDCDCDANDAHHEAIAQLFVNTLANALAEWDSNAQNSQYYKDLAWGGLDGTAIFQATTSLTDADRRRIIAANLAVDTNLPQTYIGGSGQITTVLPNGTACP